MIHIDASAVEQATPFEALIPAIREMFIEGCQVPQRHHHDVGGDTSVLIMPAWQPGRFLGIKTVNISPGNSLRGVSALSSTYQLFDAVTGVPLASIDGDAITSRRTAAASALAASRLAKPGSHTLLLAGTGRVGRLLPQAYRAVLPIGRVEVWDVTGAAVERCVEELRAQGFDAYPAESLEASCGVADVVTCATLSTQPLIHGRWMRPGSHLDLIGSFRPDMRETDEDCFVEADVWVDTEEALAKSGDLLAAMAGGVLSREHIKGTLADLSRQNGTVRPIKARTVFKAVGTALEDLATALVVWRAVQKA